MLEFDIHCANWEDWIGKIMGLCQKHLTVSYGVKLTEGGGFVCEKWLQICLLCRQRGHSLKRCPNKKDKTVDKKLCYNCGEAGHSLSNCPLPLQDGMFLNHAITFPRLKIYCRYKNLWWLVCLVAELFWLIVSWWIQHDIPPYTWWIKTISRSALKYGTKIKLSFFMVHDSIDYPLSYTSNWKENFQVLEENFYRWILFGTWKLHQEYLTDGWNWLSNVYGLWKEKRTFLFYSLIWYRR